ncbi:MAG TPA: Eco57I restriction-modification methylase domain-containing protein [Chitinophagaceae bacterium]|nr:Eco57I restriction-modification methylase domain-containing protein [Chitinophagaceae bacterium]
MDNNIKDGNSLIDTDFYQSQLDFGEERKIRPFNWRKAFPEVFKSRIPQPNKPLIHQYKKVVSQVEEIEKLIQATSSGLEEPAVKYGDFGGFDVVIGNPPYVRQEMLGEQKKYFAAHYKVYHGMADLYSYFIEKGIELIDDDGIYGVIVANKWMRANYGEPLRRWLKQQSIHQIIDFVDLPVFESATTYPCILIAGKPSILNSSFDVTQVKTLDFESLEVYVLKNRTLVSKGKLEDQGWNLASDVEQKLLKKLTETGIPLGEYVKGNIYYGVKTGFNKAFVINEEIRNRLIMEDKRSAEVIKPFLEGRDIKRYQEPKSSRYLIFTKRGINIDQYPAIREYLLQFKKQLTPRPKDFKGSNWPGRKPGSYKWYEIQDAVDYYIKFEAPKIIWGNLCKISPFTFTSKSVFINAPAVIIASDDLYLLGVMNSKLQWYFLNKIAATRQGGFIEAKPTYVTKMPIKKIDISNSMDQNYKDDIEKLVKEMLNLNREIEDVKLDSQKLQIKNKFEYCEQKLNEIVYKLYKLTPEEIRIIDHI